LGVLKKNDECGKIIDVGDHYKIRFVWGPQELNDGSRKNYIEVSLYNI
jgi:hypothetical protein